MLCCLLITSSSMIRHPCSCPYKLCQQHNSSTGINKLCHMSGPREALRLGRCHLHLHCRPVNVLGRAGHSSSDKWAHTAAQAVLCHLELAPGAGCAPAPALAPSVQDRWSASWAKLAVQRWRVFEAEVGKFRRTVWRSRRRACIDEQRMRLAAQGSCSRLPVLTTFDSWTSLSRGDAFLARKLLFQCESKGFVI